MAKKHEDAPGGRVPPDVASLKHGKELDPGEGGGLVSGRRGRGVPQGRSRGHAHRRPAHETADALIAKLGTGLVKPGGAEPQATAPATDADRLKVIDELAAAAGKRLGAYGRAIGWRERLKRACRADLKDAGLGARRD